MATPLQELAEELIHWHDAEEVIQALVDLTPAQKFHLIGFMAGVLDDTPGYTVFLSNNTFVIREDD